MTDDLKFIVNEINNILNVDYNLISFDSMSIESLLQVMVDVLNFYNAVGKFEVKFIERDECVKRILEALKKVQYRVPTDIVDPISFRRNIAQGEKRTVYPILRYIFEHKDKIKHLTYLAQFLLPIQLPNEAMANAEIANLWEEYMAIMEQFKIAHKGHTESSKETAHLKELRNDINAIEVEKDNVNKRLERTQSRLDKIPQQELLLEAAYVLRIEKDRQKELQSHLEEQTHQLQRFKTIQERLQKDLSNARMTTQSTSPEYLMENIQEETQVMEFLVKQKLPKEFNNLQKENLLLENITHEQNLSKDYISDLQHKIDRISKDIQKMVERKLAERGNQNDTLIPFRQQAATVARNKEMSAEHLNEMTKELREVDTILQRKQSQLEETIGDVILRGEELKQYVNKLRAKSSVYKQHRAELAAVKAEITDLTKTLDNLKSQDPTLSMALEQMIGENNSDSSASRPDSPVEERGLTELSRITEGLKRAVNSNRDRLTPLSQKMRPLRERVIELKDERDSKKQSYDTVNATLQTEASVLQSEILETEKIIKKLEYDYKELKTEYERAENLLNRVRNAESNQYSNEPSVKEQLQNQIIDQEKLLKYLEDEKIELFKSQEYRGKQLGLWTDVQELLCIKLNSMKEAKDLGYGGTISIDKNSETFILQ